MADIQELRRYLDEIKAGIEDINSIAIEAEEASDGLVKKVSDLAGIGTKGGIVRSIVTRGLVAFPMGYRIAQQASSALLVFRYLDKSRQERMKEEKEFNSLMSKREKLMRKLYQMQEGNLSVLDKERYYNDLSVKMKLKTMNIDEAILQARERLEESTKGLRRTGRRALMGQARRMIAGGRTGINPFLAGSARAGILQMGQNELDAMNERLVGLRGEEGNIRQLLEAEEQRFNTGNLTSSEKEAAKEQLRFLRESLRSIREVTEQVQEDLKRQSRELAEDIKDVIDESGLKVTVKGRTEQGLVQRSLASATSVEDLTESITNAVMNGNTDVVEGIEQLSLLEFAMFKYQKAKDKIREKMESVGKYFKSTDFKLVLQFFQKGLMVFAGALLAMTALVAVVFALYRAGLFEWFSSVFDYVSDIWKVVGELLVESLLGFIDIFGGIFDIIMGFVGFFYGLFTGDGDLVTSSVEKFVTGMGRLLNGLVMVVGGLFVTALMAAVGIVSTVVVAGFSALTNTFKLLFGDDVKSAVSGGVIGASIGAIGGGLIGGPLGFKIGAAAGGLIGSQIGGRMQTGGVTSTSGGTFLVGERGPELVSLPGNTRVFNNSDTSRMMSPTININVTGRVGASDTELNDIARKIGQKINIEMNRYNSSGLRG